MAGFFDRVLSKFSTDLGIDLGTANTLVYAKGRGVVVSEPSVVAVHRDSGEVLLNGDAVGEIAYKMRGVAPKDIRVVRPLKEGVIADYDITEKLLRFFIRKAHGGRTLVRPDVVIAVPAHTNDVHRDAVINAAEGAGARNVFLVDEPLAAGLGVGLPVTEPRGSMIVDMGGGTTEIGILTLGSAAYVRSLPIGGDTMDRAIVDYVLQVHHMILGERAAEEVKIAIGSLASMPEEYEFEVKGQDAESSWPKKLVLRSEEIREAMLGPAADIVLGIREAVGNVSPDLASDLIDNGLTIAGGGALTPGFDRFVEERTGLKVRIADDPMRAVVKGTGVFLEDLRRFAQVLNRGGGRSSSH